ncbi:hypothetical protein NQ318_021826 [Aromia moschata]|uniref:Uncharacterized protein n=1 Tax=Aromia moschata TaxID=1265417 RepID=A0AAV8Z763_9CUCU|nr:hypothetical protein NQ318_021826 [Aromia moschata]
MFHSEKECAALKDAKIEGNVLAENSQLIHPLRCLLFQKYKSKVWNTMMELESHLERRRNTPVWRRHMITVERVLRSRSEEELVQKVCGILDVNSFEVRPPQSHTGMIINPENQCLRGPSVTAMENLLSRLLQTFHPNHFLILELQQNLMGLYLRSPPNKSNLLRRISLCRGLLDVFCNVELGLSRLKDIVVPLILNIQKTEHEKIAKYENLSIELKRLWKMEKVETYALVILAEGVMTTRFTKNIAALGLSYIVIRNYQKAILLQTSITLYELHSATADLAHKQHREKEINEEELVGQLLLAETTLKEAIKHLLYEPTKSPEGRLAQTALSELKMLRLSINNIQKDLLNAKVDSKDSRKVLKKGDNDIKAKQTPSIAKEGNTIKNIKKCGFENFKEEE